ncbi:hypothetical protein UPYG_G00211960 [Umbra pygmaea]|uniref:SH2 domain-containing protein n=1 Tax=Umbra pygmaea TaxID=75934 RepID=A0ABD0WJY9_UMBPY
MSSDSVPTKSVVMGWNSRSLADYLKRLKLSGCDKVIMKSSMNGSHFLNMTENDLQKFPSIHIPLITRICSEINRSEDRRGLCLRPKGPQNNKLDFCQDESWDSEEFDSSDNDYESPDGGDDSYICAMSDLPPPMAEEEWDEDDYEHPPSSQMDEIPHIHTTAKPLGNSEYIDSVRGGPKVTPQTGRTPRPPQRPVPQDHQRRPSSSNTLAKPPLPRKDPSPHKSFKVECKPSVPQIDRTKKPGRSTFPRQEAPHRYPTNTTPTRDGSSFGPPQPPSVKLPQLNAAMAPDQSTRYSSSTPPSAAPCPPFHQPSKGPTTKPATGRGMDMDPGWYGGLVTRGQAEAFLRQVNKDAAFLVRDSSKGSSEQPYTLMVLSQGKVYNIQIRRQGNTYHLGTGLMGIESFSGVKEIIDHYTQTPLLLIDAMERGTGVHNECCLLYPALL